MDSKEKKEIFIGIAVFILVSLIAFDRLYYSHKKEDLISYVPEKMVQSNFFENEPSPNPFSAPEGGFLDLPIINFIKPAVEKVIAPTKVQNTPSKSVVTSTTTIETKISTTTISSIIKILLPPESPTDYKDNNNGTITDNYTNLMWSKCTYGTSGKDCTTGDPIMKEWSKARNDCDGSKLAGKTGWRLPTLKELESIVDSNSFNPAINKKFFPNSTNNPYWTSTSPAQYSASKFTVLFSDGSVYYKDGGNVATARCVRDNI